MGRKRTTGNVRQRDGRWIGTLPAFAGNKAISRSFPTEQGCRAWVADSWTAINAGLPVLDPHGYRGGAPSTAQSTTGDENPLFIDVALRWFAEYYEELCKAGPGRAESVRGDLARHILPFFHGRRVSDLQPAAGGHARDLVKQFVLHLAGRGQQNSQAADIPPSTHLLDFDGAVALTGLSHSTIKRARRDGKFPNAQREPGSHGKLLIPVADLVAAGLLGAKGSHRGLARATAADVLWILRQVFSYLRSSGYIIGDPSEGLSAVAPHEAHAHTKPDRRRPPPLELLVCRRIAARLHPVYQTVFWMQRLLGLRISEAFGFLVGDVLDSGRDGLLIVEHQGGKVFLERDAAGDVVRTRRTNRVKNDQSVRVLGVPMPLMQLLRLTIAAYHTDPATGEIDFGAPLVVGMKHYDRPDQHGYRSALDRALRAEGFDQETDGYRVRPHTLRASLFTKLAATDLDDILQRRLAGHAAGDDVHARVYILDDPQLESLRVAAETVERMVEREIGSVIVPTNARPVFARGNPLRARTDYIELILDAAYRHEGDDDPLCGTERVAAELRVTVPTARRWMREAKLPTVEAQGRAGRTERLARLSDVRALRAQLLARQRLPDLADQLGVSYDYLYRTVQRLQLDLPRDDNHQFVITDDAIAAIGAEFERIAHLHTRAVSVDQARRELGVSLSTAYAMLRRCDLTADTETDSSGAVFITRTSIETHCSIELHCLTKHRHPTPHERTDRAGYTASG